MVFSSSAMATVANVSTDTWQRMRRIPSSEILNTQQLMEVACCLPLSHLFICLWEFLCFSISDYDSDDDYDDDDDDDDVDDDDMLAFDHNSNGDYDDHVSSSSSNLDFDDYYHYPDSD